MFIKKRFAFIATIIVFLGLLSTVIIGCNADTAPSEEVYKAPSEEVYESE